MVKVQINYNPYVVKTEITINDKKIEDRFSPLMYIENKRLQEWIEPKGSWPGIFKALRGSTGDKQIIIDFVGTFSDFEDLVYAKDKYGDCFDRIELIHKNKATAKEVDPYHKMQQLRELYKKLQDGPIEEFKTEDIKKNFEIAVNSDFRIVIVAPMSSGKSTLINAMIGRDLLPAVNQATTAVITEIKDNDNFEDFYVNADDKYGNNVVKNKRATKKLISELNYKKDEKDPEGKEALIHLVQLEGPIPSLPSDVLNTVFVDTPGGNNSQNLEHEEMMDEAINDENKSLILYVFNGAQLGTNDSNIILKKIANAMKNSANGKQSRDRFLFVANRMDEFDVSQEPYEEVIENTILPQLASNGITEPNLFLASAQTAKLIRMTKNGEELSETEEEDLEKFKKRFNRSTRMLSKYASLNSSDRDRLMEEAQNASVAGKEAENLKTAEKYQYRAAEINSGIPALELAIKEYLEKYAIAIKIKTVHDTFMKKVNERNMIDNCEAEWARSEEDFELIKKELEEKKAKCDHSEKLQEFRNKVDEIDLDIKPIKKEQAKINRRIDDLVKNSKDKIQIEEADYCILNFKQRLSEIGEDAQVALDYAFNNGVKASCEEIIKEYSQYINELDSDGVFNIGKYDIKQTGSFEGFNISRVEDLLNDDKYVTEESVCVGTKKVKKKGFFSAIARLFGGGYEIVPDYKQQKYLYLKDLIRDQVTEVQHNFDKEMNIALQDTKVKVQKIKNVTKTKLEGLDQMISDLLNEIDEMLVSQDELKKKVEENKEKAEWINDYIMQVEGLLKISEEE